MALHQWKPEGVIHHSDQGTLYTSIAFGQQCREAEVQRSMGSVGDAYDDALCESFFASLECELIDRYSPRTFPHGRREVFDYIEGWYTPHRRHSALGDESPISYEKSRLAATEPNSLTVHRVRGAPTSPVVSSTRKT